MKHGLGLGRLLVVVLGLAVMAGCGDSPRTLRRDSAVAPGGSGGSGFGGSGFGGSGFGGAGGGSGGTGGAGGGGTGGAGMDGGAGRDGAAGMDGGAGRDGNVADGSGDGGVVELKIAWWGGMARADRTNMVARMFEAQNPGIKITTEFYATTQGMGIPGTDYWPTMNKYAMDGTLPDIMQHDYAYIEEWTGRNLLRALDDYLGDGSLRLADVPQALLDGGKVGGKVMAISLGTNTQAMVLDLDVFSKHSIAVPGDDWTWEDFERIAAEIKMKEGIFGFGSGLWGYTPGWKAVYLSLGQWVFSADGKALGYSDDKPWADHFEMILRLKRAGALPPLAMEPMGTNVDGLLMVTKKAAMEHVFSNQLVGLWNAANAANMGVQRNLKMLPLPKVKGARSPIYMKPSQYFAITATSRYPKEAAKFIEFFTNDIEANKILAGERGVPVNTKVLQALKVSLDKIAGDSFDLIERGGSYATALPPNDPPPWTMLLNNILTPISKQIVDEQLTPQAGVALFRAQASALLAGQAIPDGGAPGDGGVPDGGAADAAPPPSDGAAGDGPAAGTALFVVGAAPLPADDTAIQARLAAAGLTVESVVDAVATTDSATGKALVLISATSGAAGLGTKFREVAVPVIVLEPNIMGTHGFTADDAASHGTVAAQSALTIVASDHPLAAGLTGNVDVYTTPYRMVFGVPGPGAVKVASIVGNANQNPIFAYPAGTTMVGGLTAPAKRVSLFLHNGAPALTENGAKLLDAAITWAIAP
jgi:multiple sugar transport system substrate-binding protein